MFAGIVESTALVEKREVTDDGARFWLRFPFGASGTSKGASIAVNGVCLTVVKIEETADSECLLEFEAIQETLRKTNLGLLSQSSRINFERSLTLSTRIDGHLVSGHVDGVGYLLERVREGFSTTLKISLPAELGSYIAPKGSITLNGVALTVGTVGTDFFSVYIIPHTASLTNLGDLKEGELINIEIDMVARYVINYLRLSAEPLKVNSRKT